MQQQAVFLSDMKEWSIQGLKGDTRDSKVYYHVLDMFLNSYPGR